MPVSLFDESIESKVTLETESSAVPDDLPFHMLIIGDWGGKSGFSKKSLGERRPVEIDRDEFDSVLRRISPEIDLVFQGNETSSLKLAFESLDDFHPDNIFQHLPLFADLRNIRQRLKKADTFNEAAKEVRSWYSQPDETFSQSDVQAPSSDSNIAEAGNLLDQILDNKKSEVFSKPPKTELSELISNIVAPHIIRTDVEEQSKLLAVVDEVISDIMRKILHHQDFQRLESAWRGLYFLVKNIETDNSLKLSLLPLTKEELADNLSSVNDLSESDTYRQLVENASLQEDKTPWAAVFGNYEFSANVDDTATLIRIAKIAEAGNFPFISTINPGVLGVVSFAEDSWKLPQDYSENKLWTTLRAFPESSYLGFAVPRFIGRIPYSAATDPTEAFAFEEFTAIARHEEYLWLNSCFAYAVALGKNFQQNGWSINLNSTFDVENLPLYVYRIDGETKVLPCSESILTESKYNSILEQGLMTLISFRDGDRIRLSALRSISVSSPGLSGKWD